VCANPTPDDVPFALPYFLTEREGGSAVGMPSHLIDAAISLQSLDAQTGAELTLFQVVHELLNRFLERLSL